MPNPTVNYGEQTLEILNPLNVQPAIVDLLTECRHYNGTACLSFASITADGTGPAVATIGARLRLTLPGVVDLRDALDALLKEAAQARARQPISIKYRPDCCDH